MRRVHVRVDVGVVVVPPEAEGGDVVERLADRQPEPEAAVDRHVHRDRVAADPALRRHRARVLGELAVLRRRVGTRGRAGEVLRRQPGRGFRAHVEDAVGLLAEIAEREGLEPRQPDRARLAGRRLQPGEVGDGHLHPERARARLAQRQVREVELRLVRAGARGRVVRPLGIAGRVLHRALRHRLLERPAVGGLALDLPHLVQVRAVILARRVVVDEPQRAVAVEVDREVVGHRAVAARDRAADALVADLAVVHRLLGEALLRDRRRQRGRVGDHARVAPPLDSGGSQRIVDPVRERVGLAGRVGCVPGERERARRPGLRPEELGRVRGRAVDLDRRRPRRALVGRVRVVDVVVVRVDPGGVDGPRRVGRDCREEVTGAAAAGRVRHGHVVELDPRALPGRHVADRHADVRALVAGVVEVPRHLVEADLRTGGVVRERPGRLCGGVLPDEAADRVGRPGRARARVDVGADGGLVEREEDGVVSRARGRPVVDGVPLPVDRGVLHRDGVLAPVVAVVVRDRGAEVDEGLEVDEIVVALVVHHDVGVAAARGHIGPESGGAVDVELEPVVGRAVDERGLGGRPPGTALPVRVAVRVEEVQRLAFGPLGIDHRRRAEDEPAGDVLGDRRPAGASTGRAGRRHLLNGHAARREGAVVAVRRRDHAAREGADLHVPHAGREVVALVDDLFGAGCRVAVSLERSGRVVQVERDVVRRHIHVGDCVDRRLACDDGDRVQRAARGRRDAAAERARVGAGRAACHQEGHDHATEGDQPQTHRSAPLSKSSVMGNPLAYLAGVFPTQTSNALTDESVSYFWLNYAKLYVAGVA